jgi:hypothetical protein
MAEVRPLGADDWQIIRAARLRSLGDAPHAFTSTLERESSFDDTGDISGHGTEADRRDHGGT